MKRFIEYTVFAIVLIAIWEGGQALVKHLNPEPQPVEVVKNTYPMKLLTVERNLSGSFNIIAPRFSFININEEELDSTLVVLGTPEAM
tara:strand:+ start:324 stop:587 length:264 start_codon:yes stop_codon:yes gene_type:complete